MGVRDARLARSVAVGAVVMGALVLAAPANPLHRFLKKAAKTAPQGAKANAKDGTRGHAGSGPQGAGGRAGAELSDTRAVADETAEPRPVFQPPAVYTTPGANDEAPPPAYAIQPQILPPATVPPEPLARGGKPPRSTSGSRASNREMIPAVAVRPLAPGERPGDQRAILTLVVNLIDKGEAFVVLRNLDVLVLGTDLEGAGIRNFTGARETIDGKVYVSLKSLASAGIGFEFDERALTLRVTAPFADLGIDGHRSRGAPPARYLVGRRAERLHELCLADAQPPLRRLLRSRRRLEGCVPLFAGGGDARWSRGSRPHQPQLRRAPGPAPLDSRRHLRRLRPARGRSVLGWRQRRSRLRSRSLLLPFPFYRSFRRGDDAIDRRRLRQWHPHPPRGHFARHLPGEQPSLAGRRGERAHRGARRFRTRADAGDTVLLLHGHSQARPVRLRVPRRLPTQQPGHQQLRLCPAGLPGPIPFRPHRSPHRRRTRRGERRDGERRTDRHLPHAIR